MALTPPVDADSKSLSAFGLHPHSGIVTVMGGVEWFKAGHGAWHGGGAGESSRVWGFQLWLALPPEHELAPVEIIYQGSEDIAQDGPARVLLGCYFPLH
jgi:redox-sensitive bicupin YhaK (pirin superfamily)